MTLRENLTTAFEAAQPVRDQKRSEELKEDLSNLDIGLTRIAQHIPEILKDAAVRVAQGEEMANPFFYQYQSIRADGKNLRISCPHIDPAKVKNSAGYKEIISVCSRPGIDIGISIRGDGLRGSVITADTSRPFSLVSSVLMKVFG